MELCKFVKSSPSHMNHSLWVTIVWKGRLTVLEMMFRLWLWQIYRNICKNYRSNVTSRHPCSTDVLALIFRGLNNCNCLENRMQLILVRLFSCFQLEDSFYAPRSAAIVISSVLPQLLIPRNTDFYEAKGSIDAEICIIPPLQRSYGGRETSQTVL